MDARQQPPAPSSDDDLQDSINYRVSRLRAALVCLQDTKARTVSREKEEEYLKSWHLAFHGELVCVTKRHFD
jgi:hypothetical protein